MGELLPWLIPIAVVLAGGGFLIGLIVGGRAAWRAMEKPFPDTGGEHG